MSTATENELGDLHSALAKAYAEELIAYRNEGERIPPALLSSIAKYLKDNNIESQPENQDMQKLAGLLNSDLPFDNVTAIKQN